MLVELREWLYSLRFGLRWCQRKLRRLQRMIRAAEQKWDEDLEVALDSHWERLHEAERTATEKIGAGKRELVLTVAPKSDISGVQEENGWRSPVRTYLTDGQTRTGDIADVISTRNEDGTEGFLLKICRREQHGRLARKEWDLLTKLHQAARGAVYARMLPELAETFLIERRRVEVFHERPGFWTAEQIRERFPNGVDGRHLGWMFNRVLELLGFVHRQGWVHGAVLPPHLMYHAENHGLQLVGWIHAEPRGQPIRLAPAKFRGWYPPECQSRDGVTASVDIYLAARSMIWLAGGDPIDGTMPRSIPREMERFFRGCLLESPKMRCQDAWVLRKEFGQLLERLYGPPAYHVLDMS